MIRNTKARTLAYEWHGGQDSPLYAFASSGLVKDVEALLQEIQHNLHWAQQQQMTVYARELQQLEAYIRSCVRPTPPGARWPYHYAPWARHEMVSSV